MQPLHPGWLALADQAALIDSSRAEAEPGWQPRHDTRAALREFVSGLRSGSGTDSLVLAPAEASGLLSRMRKWGRPRYQSQA